MYFLFKQCRYFLVIKDNLEFFLVVLFLVSIKKEKLVSKIYEEIIFLKLFKFFKRKNYIFKIKYYSVCYRFFFCIWKLFNYFYMVFSISFYFYD